MSGTLFVVATPLGHLDDLSSRAADTLREVDWIACEDTRRTARLLERLGIDTPTLSCHRFNEQSRLETLLARLGRGENGALVSDGGSPAVSDPGTLLVREALDAGIRVSPVPGPSAVIAILSVAGLPADRFVFDGFLPHRAGERRRRLRELRVDTRTLVLFETPHRIHEALNDIAEVFGARRVVLGRELTKMHETLLRGTAETIREQLGEVVRGEIVLAVAGADPDEPALAGNEPRADRTLDAWRKALGECSGDRRQALRQASRVLGVKRAELYRFLAELGEVD